MTTQPKLEPMQEWQQANPLRIWRKSAGQTMAHVCAVIGVSITALQKWENGASLPNNSNMNRIAQLTGGEVTGVTWAAWGLRKPSYF